MKTPASLQDGLDAAQAALARDDKCAALCVLAELCRCYPVEPAPMLRAIEIMLGAELYDDADELIAEGRSLFPDHSDFARLERRGSV